MNENGPTLGSLSLTTCLPVTASRRMSLSSTWSVVPSGPNFAPKSPGKSLRLLTFPVAKSHTIWRLCNLPSKNREPSAVTVCPSVPRRAIPYMIFSPLFALISLPVGAVLFGTR